MSKPVEQIADRALIADARQALASRGGAILDTYDIAAYRRELDALPRTASYLTFTPAARSMQQDMLQRFGGEGFAILHGMLMVEAIEQFADRLPPEGYPASILTCYRRSLARILNKLRSLDLIGYDKAKDLLWKDFGIARQTLMPGGARVIEPWSGFPRSLIYTGGLRQFFEASRFILFDAHGNRPYFNLHTHDFELDEFNEEGWRRLFLRIADLLESRPVMKGVFVGGGWLYDPNLPAISPRLAYHRALTIPNGARTFFFAYDRSGTKSYALKKSPTRQRLYAEGKYKPELHVLIWPRKPLLAWAERERLRAPLDDTVAAMEPA